MLDFLLFDSCHLLGFPLFDKYHLQDFPLFDTCHLLDYLFVSTQNMHFLKYHAALQSELPVTD